MGGSKQLLVWQKVSALVERLNELPKMLGDTEDFGLLNQIKESSGTLLAYVAGGDKSSDTIAAKPFYEKAIASSYELETELVVLGDLEIVAPASIVPLLNELLVVQEALKKHL